MCAVLRIYKAQYSISVDVWCLQMYKSKNKLKQYQDITVQVSLHLLQAYLTPVNAPRSLTTPLTLAGRVRERAATSRPARTSRMRCVQVKKLLSVCVIKVEKKRCDEVLNMVDQVVAILNVV